jgi:hypothetical protein
MNFPESHSWQLVAAVSSTYCPGEHTLHSVFSDSDWYCPGKQDLQELAGCVPAYCPGAQDLQELAACVPAYCPGAQDLQEISRTFRIPSRLLKNPKGHLLQEVWLVWSLYIPEEQLAQVVAKIDEFFFQ